MIIMMMVVMVIMIVIIMMPTILTADRGDRKDGRHANSPEGMYTLPDGVLTKHEASNSSGCPWEPWYCTGAVWWYWIGTAWYWVEVLCCGPVWTRPFRRDISPRPPPVPSPAFSRLPVATTQNMLNKDLAACNNDMKQNITQKASAACNSNTNTLHKNASDRAWGAGEDFNDISVFG